MKVAKQLAKFYIENERFNNAETLLKEILETYLASPNAGPDDVDKTRAMLGVAYLQSQRFEEAEALLRQVVKNCESRMPLSDEPRLNAHVNWGVAKLKLGQFSEAESLLRPIVDYGREYHKTTSRVFNINLTWLALALLKEEKFAEAESLARESLDNRNQAVTEEPEPIRDQRPKGWEVFDSQALLGRVLAAQKKYAEAEPWLTKGITGLLEQKHKLEFIGRDRLAEALACLIQMYGDWGKPEEAAKWRKEQSSNNP